MIVTNNLRVIENNSQAVFVDGNMTDFYKKIRDLVYEGHRLLTHPLPASIGMLHAPVRTVLLSDEKIFDQDSMQLISSSIEKYQQLIGERVIDERFRLDYEFIDNQLLISALTELKRFKKEES